jgi:hypothetical protein
MEGVSFLVFFRYMAAWHIFRLLTLDCLVNPGIEGKPNTFYFLNPMFGEGPIELA